jgi:hypothetical protein
MIADPNFGGRSISSFPVLQRHDPQFMRAMRLPPKYRGNDLSHNGDQIFRQCCVLYEAHKRPSHSSPYWSGEVGSQFANALAERAARASYVHVLIDCCAQTTQRLKNAVQQMSENHEPAR